MAELKAKERNALDSSTFGIPELRKYPLNDAEHVRKAIQLFHHAPLNYKRSLANNIYKASKKYDIEITKDSPIYEYLNENYQNEFDIYDIWDMEDINEDFNEILNIYNEALISEMEAADKVDTAIKCWREMIRQVKTEQDKIQLLVQAKSERGKVSSCMKNGDLIGIIQCADKAHRTIESKIERKSAELVAKSRQSTNAIGSGASAIGAKVLKGATNIAGIAKNSAKRALGPGLKAAAVIGATAMASRGVTRLNLAGGAAKKAALAIGGATTGGLAAAKYLTASQRKAQSDDNVRKHAMKYVTFINKFISEIESLNTSASNSAIPKPGR